MKTTDKDSCLILVSLLVKHGVRHVVISPGSRNAPLVVALAQCDAIEKTVVIDERSAAFIALGKASIVDGAVALVCTSGTAVLNYAPAIAEAYYRKLPIVVVSADRPMEWIDQDDSQTLRQYEALSHYVKRSYNIPSRCDNDTSRWYVNRVVNDAMLCALSGRRAPVHINLQLDEPLNVRKPAEATHWTERFIGHVAPGRILTDSELTHLVERLSSPNKVLVIGGFHKPDTLLNESLGRLAMMPNVTVLCESIANIHNRLFIDSIDSTLSILDDEGKRSLTPDVVITFGGALVSRFVKQYLRNYRVGEHWHVGMTDNTIDCFQSLTLRIDMEAGSFFAQIADAMRESVDSDYSARWHEVAREARQLHDKYVSSSTRSPQRPPPPAHRLSAPSIRRARTRSCSQTGSSSSMSSTTTWLIYSWRSESTPVAESSAIPKRRISTPHLRSTSSRNSRPASISPYPTTGFMRSSASRSRRDTRL